MRINLRVKYCQNLFNPKNYNDQELNTLDYNIAVYIDKRTYLQYYWSLLKTKQLLIFTFYFNKDYNSYIIKITLFLFAFALYLTVSALFFNRYFDNILLGEHMAKLIVLSGVPGSGKSYISLKKKTKKVK